MSFPQFGHFTRIHIPSENKNALPLFQETKRLQTLCGTTLAAAPLRETAPHSPLPRADAVTGINRPRLLASSFSRRLQGDFRRSSRPPCTKRRLSLQEGCRLLVLFHAGMFHLPDYRITFSPFVKAVFAKDTRFSPGRPYPGPNPIPAIGPARHSSGRCGWPGSRAPAHRDSMRAGSRHRWTPSGSCPLCRPGGRCPRRPGTRKRSSRSADRRR